MKKPILIVAMLLLASWPANLDAQGTDQTKSQQTKKQKQLAEKLSYAQPATYKTVEGRALQLFIAKPEGWKVGDSRPAVVFFHGGGWVGGSPGQFSEHCKYLLKRGMVTVQVQYRLLPRPNRKNSNSNNKTAEAESKLPQDHTPTRCIRDAKSAMRWVRSKASELGIDPDRIAAGGGSAGGHLAAFLGTTDGTDDPQDDLQVSARANAMLLFNPVYNNGPDGWGTARVGDRFQEFSPAHNLSSDDAPAIVFLGTKDQLVPVTTAKKFQSDMKAAEVRSDLHLYEDQPHGFFNFGKDGGKWYKLTIEEVDKFLVDLGWLTKPKSQ